MKEPVNISFIDIEVFWGWI